MKKLTSLFTLFITGVMTLFAETATMQYTNTETTGNMKEGNNAASVNLDADLFSVTADKGTSANFPGLNKAGQIRLYQSNTENVTTGNTITVSITNGAIASVVVNLFTGSTGQSNVNNTGLAVYAGDNKLTAENGSYTVNAASFSIKNENTTKGAQVWITSVVITYSNTDIETTSITLDDVEVRAGKTAKVKVTANGTSPLTWSVADPTIATVADGVITGVAEGTTTVTAKVSETLSATANVTVLGAYQFPAEGAELTCAQVKEMAQEMTAADTTVVYTVVGYVIEAGNISRNQQTLWLDDTKNGTKVFQSYWGNCPMNDQNQPIQFAEGDKVKVTGRIFLFQGNAASPEITNGTVVGVEGGTAYVEEVITPSEAAELVKNFTWTNNSTYDKTDKAYTIEGWVVERTTDYSTQYKNQTFTMADTIGGEAKFTAFQVKGVDYNVEAGWKVRVSGAILMNYRGNTPESVSGAAVEILDDGISENAVELTPTAATAVYDEDLETYTFTFTTADSKSVSLTAAAKQYTRLVGEYSKTGSNNASVTDGTAANLEEATLTLLYKGQNANDKPTYDISFIGRTLNQKEYVIRHVVLAIPATDAGKTIDIEERYWASEARAIAEKLADSEKTTETYVLLGYVTEIVTAYGADSKYPTQQSFWIADTKDGGQVFQVYGAIGLTETVKVGAKVEISATILQNYKGTYETNHSSTITILEEGDECAAAEEGFIRISEAIAIAKALEDGAKSEATYKVRAKITKISTDEEHYNQFEADKKNLNITISDCSGAIDCYYTNDKENKPFTCAYAELPVKVGDEVVIEGPLKKYVRKDGDTVIGTTPEFENAWFVEYDGGSAVENIFIELNPNAPMYNILGIQVDKNYKGIVIQNGQKYLLR